MLKILNNTWKDNMRLPVINTREDLDALQGTAQWMEFMVYLRGTLTTKVDTAVRPEGYGQPGYEGEDIPAVWAEVENLSVVESFGFTKEEVLDATKDF